MPQWAQDTRQGVSAVAVFPPLKAGSLTRRGTMTMSQGEQEAAQAFIDHLDVVYEGDMYHMIMKIIHMGLN